MSNRDEHPRRDSCRPEDNPFIAFRRFADSQVSSLLNTVFTIPATIANYNNVHQAREACLFKKADKTQCEKLHAIESEIADLRHEGRELHRSGNLQQVLQNSEELMKLGRQADDLRQDIVGQMESEYPEQRNKELIQRVATRKGQEFGWDWSWGFPKPFDAEPPNDQTSKSTHDELSEFEQLQRLEEARTNAREFFDGRAWDDAAHSVFDALESSPIFRALISDKAWNELRDAFGEMPDAGRPHEAHPRSWRFPTPTDARRREEYSPRAIEADDEMRKTGVNWRKAYEDLLQAEQEESRGEACPWRQRDQRTTTYPKRILWEGEEINDDPSYEYSHDHEDQHDDPPTPKPSQTSFACTKDTTDNARRWTLAEKHDLQEFLSQSREEQQRLLAQADDKTEIHQEQCAATETELDAYEHILPGVKLQAANVVSPNGHTVNAVQPSILSTLTTTERTVAADGSVTTKVVLKKRFADGREESSETIHTQRGHETTSEQAVSPPAARLPGRKNEMKDDTKRSGWFWSS